MRQILHLDLDAFFANVEVLLHPELKGKPLIVAMGNPQGRGVVSTASYEARAFGVHSAMPLFQALRQCPSAIVVPVQHQVYSHYSRQVMDCARETSPLVEQVSIDEAYIEISPERDAVTLGRGLQARIASELGLDCTIALATNKLVSKIACNTVKPRGWIVVPPGQEAAFLAPLPIEKLPGAGKVTRAKLTRWNVKTIGDLSQVPAEELRNEFGRNGIYLHEASVGRDDSPLVTEWRPQSVSQENTFEHDTRNLAEIEAYLKEASARVARELEREGYRARTIVLKLRYGDFTTITRQVTLRAPTANDAEICSAVLQLLQTHWDQHRAIRLIGVGAHNLVEASSAQQLGLF
jgi:nucleotidyltransferase/DNA polymerase involved in DNA repair